LKYVFVFDLFGNFKCELLMILGGTIMFGKPLKKLLTEKNLSYIVPIYSGRIATKPVYHCYLIIVQLKGLIYFVEKLILHEYSSFLLLLKIDNEIYLCINSACILFFFSCSFSFFIHTLIYYLYIRNQRDHHGKSNKKLDYSNDKHERTLKTNCTY
jgi:hypothetical protein